MLDTLKLIGWDVKELWPQDKGTRRQLTALLRKVIINCPRTPMPHGKVRGGLWSHFPETFKVSEREWFKVLRSHDSWFVIPESPKEPVMLLQNPSTISMLLREDVFLIPVDGSCDILVIDHEREGPWYLNSERKSRLESNPEKVFSEFQIPGDPVCRKTFYVALARIRKSLKRKRIYFPAYRLATTGPCADHLWNYIPYQYETYLENHCFAVETLKSTNQVLLWSDHSNEAKVVTPDDMSVLRKLPDAYYL